MQLTVRGVAGGSGQGGGTAEDNVLRGEQSAVLALLEQSPQSGT